MRTMKEFAQIFIDSVRMVLRGALVFILYLILLCAMAWSFGKGCASKLPIKPVAQAAQRELDCDQSEAAGTNRWQWIEDEAKAMYGE